MIARFRAQFGLPNAPPRPLERFPIMLNRPCRDPRTSAARLGQINNLAGRGAGEPRHISRGDCGGTAPNPASISRIASFLFRACYPPVTSLIPPC
jgi:hypothetical protein